MVVRLYGCHETRILMLDAILVTSFDTMAKRKEALAHNIGLYFLDN